MLWGVYLEVLVALAQKSWENSIMFNHLKKSLKNHVLFFVLKISVLKYGFWDFSPKRLKEI